MRPFIVIFIWGSVGIAHAEPPSPVDFARDVRPIFQEHCLTCHGPDQQRSAFRLDRRRDAMRGGTGIVIGPGNSAGSRLYLRLIGGRYGTRMPLFEDPLSQREIEVVKAWIDQGARWPDEVSGEVPPPTPDPAATRLMEALRRGARWRKSLRDEPKAVQGRGPGGSTPLMYAVLYGDLASVRVMLDQGADPNVRNEAGATALMWAAGEAAKVRLLLERGADCNARSNDGRTPLVIAAGHRGGIETVKLLLDGGASTVVKGAENPLGPAFGRGDEALVRLLLQHGADLATAGPEALGAAIRSRCQACVELLLGTAKQADLDKTAVALSPPFGDGGHVPILLDRGASPLATDRDGRSLLMLAASAGTLPMTSVTALLGRGVDVNSRSPRGETALDLARRNGQTPLVRLLLEAGAKETAVSPSPRPEPQPAGSAAEALGRAIPLLQRADQSFSSKSGCISCHHNTLTAVTMTAARTNGVPLDEEVARRQVSAIAADLESWRERVLQGRAFGGRAPGISQLLLGLTEAGHPADLATDAMVRYLKSHQLPDGHWASVAHRPPSGSSEIQVTASALRAFSVYSPTPQRSAYHRAARQAASWLLRARPVSMDDRAFLLLGLSWAGLGDSAVAREAARVLVSQQRADGGWAQTPFLESDAFATGQALFALLRTGRLTASAPAYQRGVRFLLSTQLGDGSWYVRTRAIPLQPYFESGFPHGADQWISAAATNWAALALVPVAGEAHVLEMGRNRQPL